MKGEHRKGDKADKKSPERTCVVTRTVQSPETMIRFALGPDDVITPDLKGVLPGRGVWVTGTRAILSEAVTRNQFARGFQKPVKASDALLDLVDDLLEQAALQALSLTAKSGGVITGFQKVMEQVTKGGLAAVLFAEDGADGGIDKVKAKLRALEATRDVPIQQILRSEQMSLALGRSNVIHAALKTGGTSQMCLKNLQRLARYRGDVTDEGDEIETIERPDLAGKSDETHERHER